MNASTWSIGEADARRIDRVLSMLLAEAGARTALLVDRNGQMLAAVGEPPVFDQVAFASLAAADYSANDQLAQLLGEPAFHALFHEGAHASLCLADIARRVILVVVFDTRTTMGLVKLRVRQAHGELVTLFEELFRRGSAGVAVETAFVGEAEDEIDRLFGAL